MDKEIESLAKELHRKCNDQGITLVMNITDKKGETTGREKNTSFFAGNISTQVRIVNHLKEQIAKTAGYPFETLAAAVEMVGDYNE